MVSRFLRCALLRLRTSLPPLVDIRFRKPWVRLARIRLGLYVKLTFLTLSVGFGRRLQIGGAVFQMQDEVVKLRCGSILGNCAPHPVCA